MNDFKLIKLSDLVSRVKVGFVGPINEYYCEKENGVPLIRTTDIDELGIDYSKLKYVTKEFHEKNKKSQIKKGDLIIARHGENGKANVFKEVFDAQVLNAVIIEPDQNKLESNLLKYFFDSPFIKNQILGVVKGSVQGVINTAHIADVLIPMNNEINYKGLSKTVNNLDSKIELNNKINAELEQMAKTLYDYWFVQFDFPNAEGKPYKTNDGKMVWNEQLKTEIPEGWQNGTLSDISELIRGVSYDKNDVKEKLDNEVVPILRATNISGNVIDLENMVYVPKKRVDSDQLLKKYDILITMSSGSKEHIGKNGFFYLDREVAFGAFCAKLVAKDEFRFYLYSYTQSDFMFLTIKNECLGTNINNLNGTLVNGFKLVIPPDELVKRFNQQVAPIYEKVGNNLKENQKLSELRDWLLPMLMNGQVTVN